MFNIIHKFKLFSRALVVIAIAFFLPVVSFGVFAQEDVPEDSDTAVAEEIEVEDDDEDEAEEIEVEDADEEEEDEAEGEGPPEGREKSEKPEQKETRGQGADRRSRVANAVHEMLAVADRTGGLGEQIREIAKAHEQDAEEAEDALEEAEERGALAKFFIGPNYKKLNFVEEKLEEHNKRFSELDQLRAKLSSKLDSTLLETQLEAMEQVRSELRESLTEAKKGFSLFGWLNRWLSK